MSSVLDALKTHWADQDALTDLVPAARVQLGPLNPGSYDTPAVGLVAETIARGWQSSTGRYPQITVEIEAQATSVDTLEALREAMEQHLESWTADRYGVLQLADLQMLITRPAESPSRLWIGTATIRYDTEAL